MSERSKDLKKSSFLSNGTEPFFNKLEKEPDSIFILRSLYKIALLLKEQRREGDLSLLLESVYKIAVSFENQDSGELTFYNKLPSQNRTSVKGDKINILFFYLEGLKRVLQAEYFEKNQEDILKGLEDATSFGQLESKKWLLEVLKEKNQTSLGTVFVCAGWYGLLPMFFLRDKEFAIQKIFLFDTDPLSVKVSEDLNRLHVKADWKFKATQKDILSLDYKEASFKTLKANGEPEPITVSPDTIINTSCEHIKDFPLWWEKIPEGKFVILQSNDYFDIPFHVNCHSSLEEFQKAAPMKRLIYSGALDLKTYRRFLLIGFK